MDMDSSSRYKALLFLNVSNNVAMSVIVSFNGPSMSNITHSSTVLLSSLESASLFEICELFVCDDNPVFAICFTSNSKPFADLTFCFSTAFPQLLIDRHDDTNLGGDTKHLNVNVNGS